MNAPCSQTGITLLVLVVVTVSGCGNSDRHRGDIESNTPDGIVNARQEKRGANTNELQSVSMHFGTQKVVDSLRGRPIKDIDLRDSGIIDLTVLGTLPLEKLNLAGAKNVTDLSPLRNLRLRELLISETGVSDLSPLGGMPLESLTISSSQVASIEALRNVAIQHLFASDLPLLSDISSLSNMPLKTLIISRTGVSSLDPLKDVDVRNLDIAGTAVDDLSPVASAPLTMLGIKDTKVTDLRPLAGKKLRLLTVTPENIEYGLAIIRNMSTLRVINGIKAQEFWLAEEMRLESISRQ